jgi:hypothetical protein
MIKRISEVPAQLRARIAGFLYLLIFIVAPSGAKDATAANIVVTMLCDAGVALLFYGLFKPVNNKLALLAAIFRLIFVAVMSANALHYFGFLGLFESAGFAPAFNAGYGMALVPFGIHCVLTGYLIFRSSFLPKIIGIMLAIAGFGYLLFVWPSLADRLFVPYIVVPGVVGEGSLTLWLIFAGVNAEGWARQATAAR